MKIAFFVNDIAGEKPQYATTCFAMAALRQGHEVWYLDVNGFFYEPDDSMCVEAVVVEGEVDSNEAFIEQLTAAREEPRHLSISELDVLVLRNNPAEDVKARPWAQNVGLFFGQAAKRWAFCQASTISGDRPPPRSQGANCSTTPANGPG